MLEKKLRFTLSATNALLVFYWQNFGEFFWKRKLFANTVHPRLSGPRLFGSSINRSCEFAAERRESTIKETSILSFFGNSTDES